MIHIDLLPRRPSYKFILCISQRNENLAMFGHNDSHWLPQSQHLLHLRFGSYPNGRHDSPGRHLQSKRLYIDTREIVFRFNSCHVTYAFRVISSRNKQKNPLGIFFSLNQIMCICNCLVNLGVFVLLIVVYLYVILS